MCSLDLIRFTSALVRDLMFIYLIQVCGECYIFGKRYFLQLIFDLTCFMHSCFTQQNDFHLN